MTPEQIQALREKYKINPSGLSTGSSDFSNINDSNLSIAQQRLNDIKSVGEQIKTIPSGEVVNLDEKIKKPSILSRLGFPKPSDSKANLKFAGDIAKKFSFKSTEGFGETIGTALGASFINKMQDEVNKRGLELHPQVLERLQDPNVPIEQKKKLARIAGVDTPEILESIEAFQKTGKDVAAEGLGVAGTIALGAKPSSNIIGRLGMASAFGAGAGTKKGLEEDREAFKIATNAIKGGGIGLATGLFFEGIFAGIKKVAPLLGKNTYNKELQPDANELAAAIKRNADTFGEKVRNATDKAGKAIYKGGYKTMLKQAKNQVSTNGSQLDKALKLADKADNFKINKDQVTLGLKNLLDDQYGGIKPPQVKQLQFYMKKLPKLMNRQQMQKAKRLFDSFISKTDWKKVNLGNDQLSFAGQVQYMIRTNLKKAIENSVDDVAVKVLNQNMGLGMEVRDLVSKQLAQRARMKVQTTGFNPFHLISRIWDDVLFNPAVTTRGSQATKKIGEALPGLGTQLAEFGTTAELLD